MDISYNYMLWCFDKASFFLEIICNKLYNLKGRNIMENQYIQKANREYKDTVFRTLFGDAKHFLELYNAVADEHYPADTPVEPCPSNDLLAKFNDVAACIGNQLIVFFEHQSSRSVNMPLRLLSYATDMFNLHIIDKDKLYGNTQVKIPTPKFYVVYNGEQSFGTKELRLSDAFIIEESEPALELIAKVVDINPNSGEAALTRSTTLQGYSHLIGEIRNNEISGMARDKAIACAIDFCIDNDILAEFLTEHYQGVSKMLNWEYDADAEKRVLKKEAIEEGRAEGAELLAKMLKEGIPLDEALEKIKAQSTG